MRSFWTERVAPTLRRDFYLVLASISTMALSGCGLEKEDSVNRRSQVGADGTDANGKSEDASATNAGESSAKGVRLTKDDAEQVVNTLVIPFGPNGLNLDAATTTSADGLIHWVVDMEDREKIDAGVAPLKYLRVKGDLAIPKDADNKSYDVGCLFVELKDNVYYREKTWLRLSSTGVYGDKYKEVKIPLSVDMGGWKDVPQLDESITLAQFEGNTLKKFDGSICFRLDFSNAPAQLYSGEIVVQYLKPGLNTNPPDCTVHKDAEGCAPATNDHDTPVAHDDPTAPAPFACTSQPLVLKSKQKASFSWAGANAAGGLSIRLSADPSTYKGALGSFKMASALTAEYTAPDVVPQNVRILLTASPLGNEVLPAFCEVNLISDQDIGVADDGEIQGITGNVFSLPADTAKLPNLDAMTPVANVVVSNLDIPERAFSTGFPGVKNLFEWFAIRFRGQLIVPQAATCEFKLTADDGANLYLDGAKVIDNDGVHATRSVNGSVALTKGQHDFRVDYFQGPRYHITLQLLWKCGAAKDFTIMPPEAFVRPLK